jgi:hypothetical protein
VTRFEDIWITCQRCWRSVKRRNGKSRYCSYRCEIGTLQDRFWIKVEKTATCWLWTANHSGSGYGRFQIGRKQVQAHRLAYEWLIGPISPGLDLDHLCRVRRCVNPAHLEPVTRRVNLLRGETSPAANVLKTHCPVGHEYSPENTIFTGKGHRLCRLCRQVRDVSRRGPKRRMQRRERNRARSRQEGRIANGDKTRCPAGHPYDELNTGHSSNGRYCRACRRNIDLQRNQRPERKAQRRASQNRRRAERRGATADRLLGALPLPPNIQ